MAERNRQWFISGFSRRRTARQYWFIHRHARDDKISSINSSDHEAKNPVQSSYFYVPYADQKTG